ncbi:serine/threonine protein kinase [Wenzhouxiangella sp. XN201]|uniref:serine/threonine protein kinase n=1 Tax=Wenzhouxiangella sp. XN201 TaxID=2710755 RepID=UPI0013C590D4|nr:serine/threonine-protein kinase [Wenzhouxiangella sp. XN201]NEZ04271.1 serine/threonine protein kinase [Wenzhouxiangella sp. XN201]
MGDINDHDYTSVIGRSFGNFVVVRELGRGAMGAVFIGYQKTLKRQVAIKLLPKAIASSKAARQQFRDEAETIAVLSHPRIITIFESGEDEDYFYQVMQLVEGQDLARIISRLRRHPVPTRRVLPLHHSIRLVGEVLEGLEFAHEEGVVHQDLKPANILVDNRTGGALIADFGIAKTRRIEFYARGMVVGTAQYLSPEQAAADDTDRRTDIYAVGVILFELLAGTLPIRNESGKEMIARKIGQPHTFFLKPPSACSPWIDEGLEDIIDKATAIDPARRFVSARAFAQAINRWRQSQRQKAAT